MLLSLILSTYKRTDANVVIQRPETAYDECGRSLTLTCKLQKNAFSVSWLTGNKGITIARCVRNNCSKNPKYFGQYNFTFHLKLGVFNLTIVKVTTNDNGRVFVCSDGSNVASRVIKLRGFEPMLFEDIETENVMATSGCIFYGTQVSVMWIKISAISGIEEEFIPTIHRNYTSFCSNESGCLIDELMQYNVIIKATQSDNGQYFLKIIAKYGNELKKSSITTYKYIIGGQDDDDNFKDHDINPYHLAIIITVAACLFMLFLSIYRRLCPTKFCKRTSKGDIKLDNPHERKELVEKNLQPEY